MIWYCRRFGRMVDVAPFEESSRVYGSRSNVYHLKISYSRLS